MSFELIDEDVSVGLEADSSCLFCATWCLARPFPVGKEQVFICKKAVLHVVLGTASTGMECSELSWRTCEIFKYKPTTKLLNAENSSEDITVATP